MKRITQWLSRWCPSAQTIDVLVKNAAISLFAFSIFVFAVSYAFSQYIRLREHNLHEIDVWLRCVQSNQLGDRAYDFCKTKVSENYLFEVPYDWQRGRSSSSGGGMEW